jgi:hypothetical protein
MIDFEWVVEDRSESPGAETPDHHERPRPTPIVVHVLAVVCWASMSFAIGALGAWWWLQSRVEWMR